MAGRIVHIIRDETPSTHNGTHFRIFLTGERGAEAGAGAASPEFLDADGLRVSLRDFGLSWGDIDRVFADLKISVDAQVLLPERPRVGPKIVRAWFDTVINPLIDAIEKEIDVVNRRNWTWQFRPCRLELIRAASDYLPHIAWANIEQLSELYPEIEEKLGEHNQHVTQLETAVTKLYDLIVTDEEFRRLCDELLSPDSLSTMGVSNPTELFGAYPREDWLRLLAQYTVNHTESLAAHYSTARLWNRHREQFVSILEKTPLGSASKAVSDAARSLLRTDSDLLDRLKGLRRELSLQHDEPYALAGQD
ncbi:MAG TPA: hypothetical protein VK789_15240 [Bryobacteraceae bacterium]|nr:hypothetical protein [Bryobacteraceae bacterium]